MSLRLAALNLFLRRVVRPVLSRAHDPEEERRKFRAGARFHRRPAYLLHLPGPLHRITCLPRDFDWAILYFHGGAYVTGGPETHLAITGRLAALTGLPVFAATYRLAPEHSAPAAFEDAVAAHGLLLAQGYPAGRVILGGDSAGGGLALALLAQLCARDLRPAGLFAFAPWTDLALTGESLQSEARAEALLPPERMAEAATLARGDLAATDPRISALYADFAAPPPVFLQVGTTEILRDDSRRMAALLRAAGGAVTLQEWPDCPHVWQIFDGWIPEARAALKETAGFVASLTVSR